MKKGSDLITAVDLFCGVGGLTQGLSEAGIEVRAGIDLDENCRYGYERNHRALFVRKDVSGLTAKEVRKWLGEGPTLIAGCAPCQPFSILTNGSDRERSPHYPLLTEFTRIVGAVQPDYVTMENVPGVTSTKLFDTFRQNLVDIGYAVNWSIEDCSSFGVPQKRRRVVLLAALEGPAPKLLKTSGRKPSAGRVLLKSPPLKAGEQSKIDPLHRAPRLSDLNQRRIKASKPGMTWREWPRDLQLACHLKASGASFDQAYGRIDPKSLAPTITTKFFNYGSGRFGHPRDDRALTPREAALLQTFPRTYLFEDPEYPLGFTELGRLIGNAVPVSLGRAVGQAIVRHALKTERI